MPERLCRTSNDVDEVIDALIRAKLPMVVTWVKGRPRSYAQNRLQHMWNREIAEQRGDESAEYYRGYNKLRFGVPIRRRDSEEYRLLYDKHIKGLAYEDKIALMQEPIDFPVTRGMTTTQKKQFLDVVYNHWVNEQGLRLTEPENPL